MGTWETCNFPTLYADITKLFSIVSLKSTWSKDVACNHADVEQVYRSTILLPEATCSEEDVQEVSELIQRRKLVTFCVSPKMKCLKRSCIFTFFLVCSVCSLVFDLISFFELFSCRSRTCAR